MAELVEAEGGLASEGVPRAESGPRAAGSLIANGGPTSACVQHAVSSQTTAFEPISARVPLAAGSLTAAIAAGSIAGGSVGGGSIAGDRPMWRVAA